MNHSMLSAVVKAFRLRYAVPFALLLLAALGGTIADRVDRLAYVGHGLHKALP